MTILIFQSGEYNNYVDTQKAADWIVFKRYDDSDIAAFNPQL